MMNLEFLFLYDKLEAKHQKGLFIVFCNIFSYYKIEQIYSKDDNYFRFLHKL